MELNAAKQQLFLNYDLLTFPVSLNLKRSSPNDLWLVHDSEFYFFVFHFKHGSHIFEVIKIIFV